MKDLPDNLYKIFLKSPVNLFDDFLLDCEKFYNKPAHSLFEIKRRENKKIKGDMFEEFCVLYLKYIKKYDDVWLLQDIPSNILDSLKLKRKDMGIDIIVLHKGMYYAVQCKYKKNKTIRRNILSWKALSTFYAICLKTGPYEKYIVMTTCEYVTHQVAKCDKDVSICIKSFQNITKDEWLSMCNITGHVNKISDNESDNVSDNVSNNVSNNVSDNISNKSDNVPDKSDNVSDKLDSVLDKSDNVSYKSVNVPDKSNNVLKKVSKKLSKKSIIKVPIKIYDKEELRIKRLEFYDNKKIDS